MTKKKKHAIDNRKWAICCKSRFIFKLLYCLLSIFNCLLSTVYCLLSTVYCVLLLIRYSALPRLKFIIFNNFFI
ncbi:MAG: hypothetical protein FVQ77_07430 [Cytophagales bacterium]|nr:hypothetical protein [Cytophagales bacterium]